MNSEQVLRKLKMWCVDGPAINEPRQQHMKMYRRPTPIADLRSDDAIQNKRMELWDPLDGVNR